MPNYTFKLRDGRGDVEDSTGVHLPDLDSAVRYARGVVYELMRSRELETRPWCLDVYEGSATGSPTCSPTCSPTGSPILAIPFASVDPSLDHLAPNFRTMVESHSERRRLLGEVIHTVKATVRESRALVARARGKPYLASRFGKAVIRDI